MSEKLRKLLVDIGLEVNNCCRRALESDMNLEEEVKVSPSDIIYRIDVEAEKVIVQLLEEKASEFGGIILLAEGIGSDDKSVYPRGINESDAKVKIICDPIDGSRGLMFAKRSAFFLASAGEASAGMLSELDVAVMVELPTPKQAEWDVLSAIRGEGASYHRYDNQGFMKDVNLAVSKKKSVEGGFFSVAKFCYPGKVLLSQIEEELLDELFKERKEVFLPVFDDQYISSGGQLYELISGHDCFVADVRASLYELYKKQGRRQGQVCHPYDMAGALIAAESGVIVTTIDGAPFDAPLDTVSAIDWLGYANGSIENQVKLKFQSILKSHNLLR